MNKQNPVRSATVKLAKNTLQELWTIKDETAENFSSVSAYFEYLKTSQKLQTKSVKSVQPSFEKVKATVKRRLKAVT